MLNATALLVMLCQPAFAGDAPPENDWADLAPKTEEPAEEPAAPEPAEAEEEEQEYLMELPATTLRYPRAKSMYVAGIVVSSPGFLLSGGGLALIIGGAASGCSFECWGPALAVAFGVLGVGAAVPFLATGLPLWVVGGKRMRANREAETSVRLRVLPYRRDGFTLQASLQF